jgi:hypothetical protein
MTVMESNKALVTRQLTPDAWQMLSEIAQTMYESRIFGVSKGEAAIRLLFCFENRLPLTAANNGLYVVNNRLAAQSNIIAAQIRRSASYDYRIKKLDEKGCTIEILRRGDDGKMAVAGEASFTEGEAQVAGLLSKDNWKNYKTDMFFSRAISRAQRRFAPDIFNQPVYTPDELGESIPEGDTIEAQWQAAPTPAPTPAIEAPKGIVLDDLVQRFGAEAVLVANEGRIPGTVEELEAVEKKLAQSSVTRN